MQNTLTAPIALEEFGRQAIDPLTRLYQPARVKGEVIWVWLAMAYAAYWIVFVTGAYTNQPTLNNLGAVFILATLGWAVLERLWTRIDAVVLACVAAAAIPVLVAAASNATAYPDALIKHVSLYTVMALGRMLRLPAASGSKMRWVFVAQIIVILLLCLLTDRGGVYDGGTRHSGLFANPNNLALIPFLLLFFVDRRRDPVFVQIAAHAVVLGVLALSRTSGAVIGYAIGLAIYFRSVLHSHWRMAALTVVSVGGLAVTGLAVFGGESLLPETRFTKQLEVMQSDLNVVLQGNQVHYWDEERTLGSGAASGIWRLAHWRDTFMTWASGSPAQILLGLGVGSSPAFMGKLPHNEYLRILFEQGLIGFVLFMFAWSRIIGSAPPDVRYCGIIVAIYSFSENNLDNFPFMSLFILCLSAVGERRKTGSFGLLISPGSSKTLPHSAGRRLE